MQQLTLFDVILRNPTGQILIVGNDWSHQALLPGSSEVGVLLRRWRQRWALTTRPWHVARESVQADVMLIGHLVNVRVGDCQWRRWS